MRFGVAQAVTFTFERDDLGMLEQPVQYRPGGRDVSNEFSPVFNRTVAGHQCRTQFITPHYHFKKIFAGIFRQLFESHVINNEQIRLQIFI